MRLVCLFLAAVLGLASTAHADTLSQTFTFDFTNFSGTDFDSFGVVQFNPALGTLNSITETLAGDIVFTPTAPDGYFYFSTENGINYTGTASATLDVEGELTGLDAQGYEGTGYRLAVLDFLTQDGSFSSVGPVDLTYTYDYTPAAVTVTPEPASLLLLAPGALVTVGVARRRRPTA